MKPALHLAYRLLRASWFFRRPFSVGVRVILVRDRRILLVKHTYQDAWYFPGGGVKKGETFEQAIRRESAEEAGAALGALALFGIYTSFSEYKNDHIAVFTCAEFHLSETTNREIESVQFFPLDELPGDLAPGCRRRMQEYLAGTRSNYGLW